MPPRRENPARNPQTEAMLTERGWQALWTPDGGELSKTYCPAHHDSSLPDDWQGGFLCPCHGSTFDLAGRVFKNKPAPTNLEVPPHMYLSDTKLLIGEDKKA